MEALAKGISPSRTRPRTGTTFVLPDQLSLRRIQEYSGRRSRPPTTCTILPEVEEILSRTCGSARGKAPSGMLDAAVMTKLAEESCEIIIVAHSAEYSDSTTYHSFLHFPFEYSVDTEWESVSRSARLSLETFEAWNKNAPSLLNLMSISADAGKGVLSSAPALRLIVVPDFDVYCRF